MLGYVNVKVMVLCFLEYSEKKSAGNCFKLWILLISRPMIW